MLPRLPPAAAVLAATTLAAAGPTAPPPGPVCPTYRTLAEIEPRRPLSDANTPGDEFSVFTITQPGTYYLTGDITAPASAAGITVLAPDVTIDLGGFMIRGETGSASGIVALGAARLIVRNGRIIGTSSHGIYAESSTNCTILDVTVDACDGPGFLTGPGSLFERCTARGCGGDGFRLAEGAIARRCIATDNIAAGFNAGAFCEMTECTARANQSGFAVAGCIVRGCNVVFNRGMGISVSGSGSVISDNYCALNCFGPGGGPECAGICVLDGSNNIVADNTLIRNNQVGVRVIPFGHNLIVRNRLAAHVFPALIAGGNFDGPFVDPGNNTNPDANYSF